MIYIGIDTGVHTGYAEYDSVHKRLLTVSCLKIHQAMHEIIKLRDLDIPIFVRVEDARQRTWYGYHTAKQDRARLQGAGSVKRDCQIWEDYLKDLGVDFQMVAPKHNATKMDAKTFQNVTGWKGRTNEHSRDAAMLVYGF